MKAAANATIAKGDVFKFGSNPVNSRLVFFQNMYVFAFLVPNPICHLKGHTIITPKRNVSNVSDLNVSELFDLSLQTQFISGVLKKFYSASSLTIHMRDGQSQYDNCCVHLLPRKGEDIAYNDDIYKELQNYVNSVYSQMNPRDFNNLDDQCMKLSGMVMDKERKAQEDSWIK